jgi:hypothetical protein
MILLWNRDLVLHLEQVDNKERRQTLQDAIEPNSFSPYRTINLQMQRQLKRRFDEVQKIRDEYQEVKSVMEQNLSEDEKNEWERRKEEELIEIDVEKAKAE